jgi:hypothetical protein
MNCGPRTSNTSKSKGNNLFWKVINRDFGKITRLEESFTFCLSFRGKDVRNLFGISPTVVHKTTALKCNMLNSAKPQWIRLVKRRSYSRYFTLLMLGKVRMKFRDLFPFCCFPTLRRPLNKYIWLDECCFSFASGIHLKINVKRNLILVFLLRRSNLCLMLNVFGDHQQGTCSAGIRQDENALGSSKSLNIEICKRQFSEKGNAHFLNWGIPIVFYVINIIYN